MGIAIIQNKVSVLLLTADFIFYATYVIIRIVEFECVIRWWQRFGQPGFDRLNRITQLDRFYVVSILMLNLTHHNLYTFNKPINLHFAFVTPSYYNKYYLGLCKININFDIQICLLIIF